MLAGFLQVRSLINIRAPEYVVATAYSLIETKREQQVAQVGKGDAGVAASAQYAA